ncbi:hypothetical protein MASR2M36_11050 [Providencia sp.]
MYIIFRAVAVFAMFGYLGHKLRHVIRDTLASRLAITRTI